MTISNQATTLLDSVLNAQTTRQDIEVSMLRKAMDTMKQQGDAEIQLIEQAGIQPTSGGGSGLNVLA